MTIPGTEPLSPKPIRLSTMKTLHGLAAILLSVCVSYAQNSPVNIDYTPPSPNASSLGKYGDIPVGYYTGIPKIDIPIYTISSKYLSLPVSLSYHAGGVRVEEIASSVGLGWSLNAGGIVSRALMGLNDERRDRGFMKTVALPVFDELSVAYYNDIQKGLYDGQADNFNFSFGEYVGKFVINKSEEVVKTPRSRMKLDFVQAVNLATNENEITKWSAVGEDGTKYFFEDREMTTNLETVNLIGETTPITEYPVPYASSWYITKMVSANGLEEYTFEYETDTLEYYQNIVETVYSIGTKEPSKFQSKIRVIIKRLERIVFPTGTIEFNYFNGSRCDLIGDKALQSITITDGAMVKEFELGYSYFDENGVSAWSTCSTIASPDNDKRLRLDYVTEAPNSSQPRRHAFEYNEDVFLPGKFSNAQDHWGYYNGKSANTTLIPEEYKIAYSNNIILTGADREPSADHVTAGCLKKITYPTGGNTEFDLGINYAKSNELANELELVGLNLSGMIAKQDTAYIRRDRRPFVELRFFGFISDLPSPDCFVQVTINGPGLHLPLIMFPEGNFNEKITINIPHGGGDYIFSTSIVGPYGCTFEDPYSISISWENELATVNKPASGVRVNKITNNPLFGEPTHQYFTYELTDSTSSGTVVTTPRYGYWYSEYSYLTGMRSNFYVRTQFTNNPLMLTQGGVAGYARVLVADDSLWVNGFTEYTYTSPGMFPDNYGNTTFLTFSCLEFPFAPVESNEWQRGLLLSKAIFKRDGDDFTLVTKENNYYQYDPAFPDVYDDLPVKGVKTGVLSRDKAGAHAPEIIVLTAHFYEFSVHKQLLARTIKQSFHGAHVLSDTVKYTYSPDFFLLDKSTHKSDAIFRSKYFYPLHYPSDTVMAAMVSANILNNPVSIESWVETQAGTFLLSGSATQHVKQSPGKFFPNAFWYFKGKIPQGSVPAFDSAKVVRDETIYERTASVVNRDVAGNIREFIDRDSLRTVFIWDADKRYAISKVINASYTEVYHSSFEEVSGSTDATSKTGSRARVLSGALSITSYVQPHAGKDYVLTYWWKPTLQSSWQLQVEEYNNVSLPLTIQTIKSSGYIDELRFCPKDSQMSTFSYISGVGVSTITDVNHVTARFEYDAQHRLICVRDLDGNILSNYRYNYLDLTLPYQP